MTGGTEERSGPVTRAQKQSFEEAANAAGIKPTTLQKLIENDFDSIVALKEMQDDDLDILDISRGQMRMLLKWRTSLHTPAIQSKQQTTCVDEAPGNSQAREPASQGVTTQCLAKDQEVRQLLESMKDALPGDQLWNDTSNTAARDIRDAWDDNKSAGKPLLIPDFVSKVSSGSCDPAEQEVIHTGSSQLVLRSIRSRPQPEQVTLAQWISANSRIMSKLISSGQLSNNEQILNYLQYVTDFGDYAQTCEIDSLMIYDNEYRKKQASTSRKWGEDDVHLCTFHLQRRYRHDRRQLGRRQQQQQQSRAPAKPPRLLDSAGVEICRNFNAFGCFRQVCHYSHVCAICKDKSHPKSKHDQASH